VFAAFKLGRPVDEITAMHPRDLATLLDLFDEAVYAAGDDERKRKRLEAHGLAG
jgi:hypothetical protein